MVLVDTNVLSDIFTDDPRWRGWSEETLLGLVSDGESLAINPVIFAELAAAFSSERALQRATTGLGLVRLEMPYEAGFRASRAFLAYRRAGGEKRSPLPDFLVGAHAEVSGLKLVTRDVARYRTYFPSVALISPDQGTG